MPVAPTYPGVYVEELPSSVHTITGVSTAVTAFLGYFSQGPINQAQQVFSIADVERAFGSLIASSEAGYGLGQFFANGGAEAYVVRVAAANPGTTAPAAATCQLLDTSSKAVLNVAAASPGSWGDGIRLGVDYNTSSPGNSFNLTVTQVDTSNPPRILATEVWRNLTLGATDPTFACAVVNADSALVSLSVPASASTSLPAPNGTMSGDISAVSLTTLNTDDLMVAFGTGGSPPSLTQIPGVQLPRAPANLTDLAGLLQTLLQGLGTPPAMPSAAVTVVNGTGTAQYLQISAVVANPASQLEFTGALATTLKLDQADASTQPVQFALGATAATEGNDGGAPDAGGLIGDPSLKTGLYALDGIAFNLLCLPDVMNFDDDNAAAAVISAAETFCAPRWAFLLVDVPQGGAGQATRDTLNGIQDWLAQNGTLRSSYAALYFPRPQIPDPLNNYRLRSVAPSGTLAGLYAQTDGTRGVWKAPAGTAATLANVSALNYLTPPPGSVQATLTDAENGVLNPLGINCLRSLPVYGNVCWGARTLDGADQIASQWKYVPVRRLALYLEASLYQGTQWVVFEPNDEPLWAQIRLNVGSFLRGLFQQGAFQGSTPSSAYFVRCDSTTTTQADINNGVVNILVGFAPLLPAEFVILQIQQIAGQIPT